MNISVNTPYPGTESWVAEGGRVASRDYRLYDIQHAVLPTRLPLAEFYDELVATQRAFYRKHLGWRRVMNTAGVIAGHLMHGQTNFVRSLSTSIACSDRNFCWLTTLCRWSTKYPCRSLPRSGKSLDRSALYIHPPRVAKGARSIARPNASSRCPDRNDALGAAETPPIPAKSGRNTRKDLVGARNSSENIQSIRYL